MLCVRQRPVCGVCGTPMANYGIGSYEFWGSRGNDVQWECPNYECPSSPDYEKPPETEEDDEEEE